MIENRVSSLLLKFLLIALYALEIPKEFQVGAARQRNSTISCINILEFCLCFLLSNFIVFMCVLQC
jgi:hypothetical protein